MSKVKAKRVLHQCACCEFRRVCTERPTYKGYPQKPDGGKAFFCDRCSRECGGEDYCMVN